MIEILKFWCLKLKIVQIHARRFARHSVLHLLFVSFLHFARHHFLKILRTNLLIFFVEDIKLILDTVLRASRRYLLSLVISNIVGKQWRKFICFSNLVTSYSRNLFCGDKWHFRPSVICGFRRLTGKRYLIFAPYFQST